MSNKWVNPQPKLVPQPYTNLLTERDIGKPPILETRHLGIDFGGLTAVADFNLAIGRTEITGLIGPNGAGKTTLLGILTGSISFAALSVTVGGAEICYGNFVQAVLNFLVMALVVFCMVKAINSFHRKKEAPADPEPQPEPSAEETLLAEIRDLLKNK